MIQLELWGTLGDTLLGDDTYTDDTTKMDMDFSWCEEPNSAGRSSFFPHFFY